MWIAKSYKMKSQIVKEMIKGVLQRNIEHFLNKSI